MKPTKSWISTPRVKTLLETLYADARKNDPLVRQAAAASGTTDENRSKEYYKARRGAYMAVGPGFGDLLYTLARTSRAKTIVEFGLSFGVSTIFLASALRDNGEGRVITTEFEPEKAERAKRNLVLAGLEEWVEIRVGDALETLRVDTPKAINLVLLDGAEGLYLDILKLLEPELRPGAVIASDNTDNAGLESFLSYIRNPENGYTSSAILTTVLQLNKGHEITLRN
jgi:predicted O-methyltransferase YrrM